ncbi:MAG: ribonuclease J [Bacilli bacterium]|jgi:ribonuclease J
MSDLKHTLSSPVEIYALGGLGEVGKNLYCVENDNSLLIVDCGVMFPDSNMPGIDYIIPDFTHLKENQEKIKALVITHGHEDHIGGIPFLLQQINIPVIYAPKIAAALIRHKLKDDKINTNVKIVEYDEDDIFQAGDFKMEFYHVTHSIPDSFGIYITTPQGTIVESGDFKIDLTPVDKDFDIPKLVHFGDQGIDLLMADSTNAEKEGYTPSERTVIQGIQDVFSEASGRLIISTFSSNICRIQQIIETSMKFKRKIIVFGRSMESNIEAAREFGYIKVPDSFICAPEDLRRLPPEEVCILCTGTQGEPMAVLSRIARGDHRFIHVLPGDTIVFSSSVIPGNTASINAVINQLTRLGASVITNSVLSNLHASGHSCRQEMRLFQKLCRPHYFMPIHGEYRMLKLHADIGVECGLAKDHTFVCENGDVLTMINHQVSRGGEVQADAIYIDGKSTVSVSTSVMKDRGTLINEGMVGVFLIIDTQNSRLVSSPVVESKGFISSNKKALQKKASEVIGIEVDRLMKSGKKVTYSDIKSTVKTVAGHFLYRESHRNPMVIPVILNYNEKSPSKKVPINY